MISKSAQSILCSLGFKFRKLGEKFKERYEVVYRAPFDWHILYNDFDINKPAKKEEYNESPYAKTVCHYFTEQNEAEFYNAVINDIKKYITVLNAVIQRLEEEKDGKYNQEH